MLYFLVLFEVNILGHNSGTRGSRGTPAGLVEGVNDLHGNT